jgi:Holliday junction resolvase
MVASIPPELHIANEHYYHSIMLMWMKIIGFEIQAETSNNLGRADIVWKQQGVTVVAEIKYHAKTKIKSQLKEAMKQIYDRRYYNKYTGKVILLGIAFLGKNVGCKLEELKFKKN